MATFSVNTAVNPLSYPSARLNLVRTLECFIDCDFESDPHLFDDCVNDLEMGISEGGSAHEAIGEMFWDEEEAASVDQVRRECTANPPHFGTGLPTKQGLDAIRVAASHALKVFMAHEAALPLEFRIV